MNDANGLSQSAPLAVGLVLALLIALGIALFWQTPVAPQRHTQAVADLPGADETDAVVSNAELDAANRSRDGANREAARRNSDADANTNAGRTIRDHSWNGAGARYEPQQWAPDRPMGGGPGDPVFHPARSGVTVVDPAPAWKQEYDFDRFAAVRKPTKDLRDVLLGRIDEEELKERYRDLRLVGGQAKLDLARADLRIGGDYTSRTAALKQLLAATGSSDAKLMLGLLEGSSSNDHQYAWMYFATRTTPLTRELSRHLRRRDFRQLPALELLLAIVVNHPDNKTWQVLQQYGEGEIDRQRGGPEWRYPLAIVSAHAWGTGARFPEDTLTDDPEEMARNLKRQLGRAATNGAYRNSNRLVVPVEPDNSVLANRSQSGRRISTALVTFQGVLPELTWVQVIPPSKQFDAALRLVRQHDRGEDTPGVRRLWREGLAAIGPCIDYAKSHPVEAEPGDRRQRREPADTSHPGIDDVLFLTSLRIPALAPEIETIGIGALTHRLADIRGSDPLRVRRLELVRKACVRYFTQVGANEWHAGREFVSQMLANLDELGSMDAQMALFRCIRSLDDPHLIPAMLKVPAARRDLFWAFTMTSLTRHTLGSDEANRDPEAWSKWLDANVPSRRVRVNDR